MKPYRILIINPNTTQAMTDALEPLIDRLGYSNTEYTYFTSPSGVASVDNADDALTSAHAALPFLIPLLPSHDAALVACYSQHPLVPMLRQAAAAASDSDFASAADPGSTSKASADPASQSKASADPASQPKSSSENTSSAHSKPITGIFEASVTTALNVLGPGERFGIVSTGVVWEQLLTSAVEELLLGRTRLAEASSTHEQTATWSIKASETPDTGGPLRDRFAGVQTTGLSAVELHATPPEEVQRRVCEATLRLIGSTGSSQDNLSSDPGNTDSLAKASGNTTSGPGNTMSGSGSGNKTSGPVRAVLLGCAGMAVMESWVREVVGSEVWVIDGVRAGVGALQGVLRL